MRIPVTRDPIRGMVIRRRLVERNAQRRQAKEERLEIYRLALNNIYDAVFLTDLSGDLIFVSPNVDVIFGYSAGEVEAFGRLEPLLGEGWFDSGELFAQGDLPNLEREITDKAGQARTLLVTIKHLDEGGGRLLYTCRDITERRRAQAALEECEISRTAELASRQGRINEILESIGDGFFALDREWRFTYLNRQAAHTAGLEPEDLVGANLWETYPELLGTPLETNYRRTMEAGTPAQFEYRGLNSNRWYSIRVYPSREGISVFWLDITERKRTEQEREAHLSALAALSVQHADARLQAEQMAALAQMRAAETEIIFDAITDAVIVYDAMGRVTQANPAAVQIYGFDPVTTSREEAIKRLSVAYPDGRPVLLTEMPSSRALKGRRVTGERYVFTSASGDEVSIQASASPLYGLDGKVDGAVAIWHNITDLERAARLQQRLLDENLRQRELLERLVREAPVGIAILTGPEHRYLLANPAYKMQARGHGDLEGRAVTEVFPELNDQVGPLLDKVFSTGQPFRAYDQPFQMVRDKGPETVYFTFSYTPLYNEQRKVESLLVITQDTTEQVRAREQAEAQRALLETVFESDPSGIAIVASVEGVIQMTNLAYRRLTPHPEVDPAGCMLEEIWPPAEGFQGLDMLRPVLEKGESVFLQHVEWRYPDGSLRSFRFHLQPLQWSIQPAALVVGWETTELVQARREVESERNLLRAIFESAPEGIVVADAEGRVLLTNPTAERLYARPVPYGQRVEAQAVLQICDPEGVPIDPRQLPLTRSALDGETIMEKEMCIHRPDGQRVPILVNTAPIRTADGQVNGAVGLFQDITERKQLEERLAYQALILEHAHDAIMATDVDRTLTSWNRAAEELYGWKAEEVLGRPVSEVILTKGFDEGRRQEVLKQLAASGLYQEELVQYHRDGSRVYVEATTIALRDAAGQITSYVGAARDITYRKQAEAALLDSERRERAHAAELQAIMDAVPAMVLVAHDPQCRVVTGSRSTYELLRLPYGTNLSATPAVGEAVPFSVFAEEGEGEAVQLPLQLAASQGIQILDVRQRVVLPDGRSLQLYGNVTPLLDDSGHSHGAVAAFTDVTRLMQAEQALQEYANRLEKSNRELKDFAFIASHDLQEPLRKIQAFGDRLTKNYSHTLDDMGLSYLERMQNAAWRMSSMINGLLAYSRVTTKARPFQPVDLAQVVREVLSDLEVRLDHSGGQVEVGDLPIIEADLLQMRQLFQNLLSNALKFHRPGVPPMVKITARTLGDKESKISLREAQSTAGSAGAIGDLAEMQSGQTEIPTRPDPNTPATGAWAKYVEIVVADNGIGFDPQHGERLFQPFQRLVGRSEFEGSGIGLAICRKIAERHQGSITAHGQPGQGAQFIIRLPIKQG